VLGGRTIAALAVGAVAIVALPQADLSAAGGSCAVDPAWGDADLALAAEAVDLINAHRGRLGLGALGVSASLKRAAEWKSAHMLSGRYLAHDDPAPLHRSWQQRLRDCGYGGSAMAENIASGQTTAAAAVRAWLDSPGHRKSIESPGFTTIGLAAVRVPGAPVYWTQTFGSDGPRRAPATSPGSATLGQHSTVPAAPARVVTRRALRLGARRARALRPRARRGASAIVASIRVRSRGAIRVRLRCNGRLRGTAVGTRRRAAVVRYAGPRAGSCRIALRTGKRPVRLALTAVTR
jgi:uncharacterized protein YkwD